MKKKVLSLLLVTVMLFALGVSAYADGSVGEDRKHTPLGQITAIRM